MRKYFVLFLISNSLLAQKYSHEDTLRGSITPQRAWWDLLHYDLKVTVDPFEKFISGENNIVFKVIDKQQELQIDLQEPLVIKGIYQGENELKYRKEGKNAYFVSLSSQLPLNSKDSILVKYEGKPREAIRAPWDGGFSWKTDKQGLPFVATSCQGLGASVWWPCKDHMYDEPENGMTITVACPKGLIDISNGRLIYIKETNSSNETSWKVKNPINNYGVNINIGNYVHFSDEYNGLNGPLSLNYYVLPEHLDQAKIQFQQVEKMLEAFEYWFGPYPFYEDGYKLVEVPYLGMEHQSSVTYGNNFQNGYLGKDLSGSGWGLKWDFIIIHESGHEWFANNITYKDIADMWIHEGFTNYSETLFTEYFYGKEAGQEYVIGTRKLIRNDKPIIGDYDVNQEGSGDMYFKGGNMLHTIRHIINDDEKFRSILIGLNKDFNLQTVKTSQIENYISEKSGIDFSKVFDQYLRTTKVPKLSISKKKKYLYYCWSNVVEGFEMPLKVTIDGSEKWITPKAQKQKLAGKNLLVDKNFYIITD